jgi:GT2 family glycosyltransferase
VTDQPAVSVIVLGYNGREYVRSCLPSVLDQDFERPYEVVFVDNGSRDGTADEAAKYEGVEVHRLDRNYGYCQGNNIGAERASGRMLVFLNQDVIVHRAWLRELVQAIEGEDDIKAAHPSVIHPWNREYAEKDRYGLPATAYTPDLSPLGFVVHKEVDSGLPVHETLFISGVSTILKRDVIDEIGGYVFDPGMFAYGEDLDLALRLRMAGYRSVVASRSVIYHDHTLDDRMSLRTFLKTVRIIRNRLLAFWKCSYWFEFLPLAAICVVGSPFNASQFGLPLYKKVLYFVLLTPPTLAALAATFMAMPSFAERRRQTLSARRRPRGWLLRALFDRSLLKPRATARSRL